MKETKSRTSDYSVILGLFGSLSTLVCCALPALFVTLGAGAVLAGLITRVPGLVWMSERKEGFLVGGGVLIVIAGIFLYRSRGLPCPVDPKLAESCDRARRRARVTYAVSVVFYLIGLGFSVGNGVMN